MINYTVIVCSCFTGLSLNFVIEIQYLSFKYIEIKWLIDSSVNIPTDSFRNSNSFT